jgi:hypothetical protein
MSITNIERMVDALVRDEMNYLQSMDRGDLMVALEDIIRDKIELMGNGEIVKEYESLV